MKLCKVVLVCGGRDLTNEALVFEQLDAARAYYGDILVVEGGANGADTLARLWAENRGCHCATVKALWKIFGKNAGGLRNSAMLLLKPEVCLAFPTLQSRGTWNMIAQAKRANIATYIFKAS